MSRLTERTWGFALVKSATTGRTVAQFTCAKCPTTLDVNGGAAISPDHVVKVATRKGWVADMHTAGRTRCPTCATAKTVHHLSREPLLSPEKVIHMPEPKATVPRELTQAERLKVRSLLDKQFDDSAGCYLDGYSDQKIGEEVGVPWALVTKVREAAYGPIRVDPEVSAIRAEIGAVKRAIGEASEKAAKDIAALSSRIAALEKRSGELLAGRAA